MTKRARDWIVEVYTPGSSPILFRRLEIKAMTVAVARSKAREKVRRLGKLAHFYTYVPLEVKNSG